MPIVGVLADLLVAWSCVEFHSVLLTTLVQRRIPREIRGRVFGILTMIRVGLFPLGMAFFGVLVDHPSAGPEPVLFWTGAAGLAILATVLLSPSFSWIFVGHEGEIGIQSPSVDVV